MTTSHSSNINMVRMESTLLLHTHLEASRYLPILEKNLGEGNFDYILNVTDDDWDEELEDDEDEEEEEYEEEDLSWLYKEYGPEMPYT